MQGMTSLAVGPLKPKSPAKMKDDMEFVEFEVEVLYERIEELETREKKLKSVLKRIRHLAEHSTDLQEMRKRILAFFPKKEAKPKAKVSDLDIMKAIKLID